MSDKLVNPTVKEMIAWLQQMPPDARFRIEDPDTNWTIAVIHGWQDEAAVWVTGEYGEMSSRLLDAPLPDPP